MTGDKASIRAKKLTEGERKINHQFHWGFFETELSPCHGYRKVTALESYSLNKYLQTSNENDKNVFVAFDLLD